MNICTGVLVECGYIFMFLFCFVDVLQGFLKERQTMKEELKSLKEKMQVRKSDIISVIYWVRGSTAPLLHLQI